MRVIFCGLKYEYGKKEWGLSFEYQNFFEVLKRMPGVEVELFAIDEQLKEYGRDEANHRLVKKVIEWQPHLLFTFLFTEELKKETIHYITDKTDTKTFNWFADDHWRFPIFSKRWASVFTMIGTTDSWAEEKYRKIGVPVIRTQWAANPFLFRPMDVRKNPGDLKITFVGKKYGRREEFIKSLQDAGLPAEGYGVGWQSGAITFERMIEIFSFSLINLNFSASAGFGVRELPKMLGKLVIKKELGKYMFDGHHLWPNLVSLYGRRRAQIKGRVFEVPACGGFLLTQSADDLYNYFVPDKEIVLFNNKSDLIELCRYYLANPHKAQEIAQAGFKRVTAEHTYVHRFEHIFKALNLSYSPVSV